MITIQYEIPLRPAPVYSLRAEKWTRERWCVLGLVYSYVRRRTFVYVYDYTLLYERRLILGDEDLSLSRSQRSSIYRANMAGWFYIKVTWG